MRIWRIVLGVVGIGTGTYGISQLLTQVPRQTLMLLALWLIAALIIHDGLLSPAIVGVGAALRRYVPDRGRRYLQFGLIMAAMVTVIAVPLIYRAQHATARQSLTASRLRHQPDRAARRDRQWNADRLRRPRCARSITA